MTSSPPEPSWALVPAPDVMNTPPPFFESAWLSPAFITTAPPFSVSPDPTSRFTSPPAPVIADPVASVIPPLSPTADAPVSTLISPLTPSLPLVSVRTSTSPLERCALRPLDNKTAPPLPSAAVPPRTSTSPPRAYGSVLFVAPPVTTTAPPTPPDDRPPLTSTAPPKHVWVHPPSTAVRWSEDTSSELHRKCVEFLVVQPCSTASYIATVMFRPPHS
mmetsp:Transcript_6236/g.25837  ORF Transcript_6236/g.25837 Transcript_6236/m.25837 type:complete len:218 (+) Transcript_6236:468-1121(+)